MVGGGFVDDAADDGGGFRVAAYTAVDFGEAEVDEEEFLALIPVLEDCGVGVGAADTAETA